jgi:hypothetical protein
MSTVTLELRPDTEKRLREKAARTGQTLEGFLLQAAERLAVEEAPPLGLTATELTPEQRSAALRAWVTSHKPLPTIADDSRESIYEGRGE